MMKQVNCKLCQAETNDVVIGKVMGRYEARYVKCTSCGFMFVVDPTWLGEAYGSAITSTDLGTVSRTDQNSLRTKAVIDLLFPSTAHFLDYGAGYGMFVRRMRDLGYAFLAYDPHCENLFANEAKLEVLRDRRFDLITAFEVFEHLEDPLSVFNFLLKQSDNLLITTELLPDPTPALQEWWYYGLDHGQHISFYTPASLKVVAQVNARFVVSDGTGLHLFSRRRINGYWFRKITQDRTCRWLGLWKRRKSLLQSDWEQARTAALAKLVER
jgi:hypothetical protein